MSAAGRFDFSPPCRLWSLWEMLSKYAWQFFLLSRFLEDICHQLGVRVQAPPSSPFNALAPLGSPSLQLVNALHSADLPDASAAREWLSEDKQSNVLRVIHLLGGSCRDIGINGLEREIGRIASYVSYKSKAELVIHVKHLIDRITDELESSLFLHIPKDKTIFYRPTSLFGEEIGTKFPKCAEDVANAGTCYALGQNTACVFHLMRVMEHCVQRFGRKLHTSIDPARESWHQIMLHVHRQVNAMPGGASATRAQNARKQRFSMAAARLDHVRIVWRNDVMHPKATYDEAEAREVLTGVEAFLKSVVSLL